MEYKTCLTFVFILSAVFCEKCVSKPRDTFLISNFGTCQAKHQLTFNQASVSIDNQNNISNILTPIAQTTCLASNTLSVVSGGVLEAEVYSQSITNEDYLTILVFGEDNNVVGHATLHGKQNGHNDGRQVLKVPLGGVGHYDGIIMIISKTSLNSDISLVSMCYSPVQQRVIPSEYALQASHYDAPDVYNLQIGSILKYPVYPNENIHTTDVVNEKYFWIFDREDFWTPLTISLAVIIPVIFLALLCWACFALGKSRGAKEDPQLYEDFDNLPKPYLVPRVKSVYSESVTGSNYGDRNNNIYSV